MQQFLALLKRINLDLDAEMIADILWLASQIDPGEVSEAMPSDPVAPAIADNLWLASQRDPGEVSEATPSDPVAPVIVEHRVEERQPPPPPEDLLTRQPQVAVQLPRSRTQASTGSSLPFQAPAAPALRNPLELGRSLRPLMRKVPSRTEQILDEEATAIQIAESAGQRQWIPIFQPAPERWLDLALVVEESRSTAIWQELITEFQTLLEQQGAFRHISIWSLRTDRSGNIALYLSSGKPSELSRPRSPRELLDPSGRQLVLLLSDCVSSLWRQGKIHPILKQWSDVEPTAIVQFLPERLWTRSGLGLGLPAWLSAFLPGVANSQLEVTDLPVWETVELSTALVLPIVTLEPASLGQWAQVVGGMGKSRTAGIVFDLSFVKVQSQVASSDHARLAPEEVLQRFRTTASPMARRLAGLMSLVPVSLPIIYLIQEAVLPASRQVHIAEVFMSGLLEPQATSAQSASVQYEFVPEVRELLQRSVPKTEALMVLDKVSQYIADRAGLSVRGFAALLVLAAERGTGVETEVQRFAALSTGVLRRMGGEFAAFVDGIDVAAAMPVGKSLNLQTFEFDVAEVEFGGTGESLQPFEFETVTLTVERTGILRRGKKLVQTRSRRQAYCFTEPLGNECYLEMVAIPAGSFLMGSPKDELERSESEGPQHTVTIKAFFLGKYPVTQAQWKAVAALPQVNRELNPDPSSFKGENRPVEQISWLDAIEFCDRLSKHTGKQYRLPSEAEWEYACRAGTTAPFHFGETITSDLANYNGEVTYGSGPKGIYQQETTPVGSFGVANAFGLYDMHGNVWEWCMDHWHKNYEGAPTNGSAWLDDEDNQHLSAVRWLLRGGSWFSYPPDCRSAYRDRYGADRRSNDYGFRVACAA